MRRQLALKGLSIATAAIALLAFLWWQWTADPASWTADEIALLKTMSLTALGPPLPDPSNRVADDPRAALLGQRLFFDTRLSANNQVSCATCHQPEIGFADGRRRGVGIGLTERNTRGLLGVAYSEWFYWDGRRDSLWSQALVPIEHPEEQGSSRAEIAMLISLDDTYRTEYEAVFGESPDSDEPPVSRHHDRLFANVGKAIAAYERTLVPERSRFDDYVDALAAGKPGTEFLSADEVRGLRLFVGKASCIDCHNGPLFTNNEFHNTGVLSAPGELPDRGRSVGRIEVLEDRYNCLGEFSDDPARQCAELRFARSGPELLGAMRTPGLRGVAATAPYMHRGQIETLADVVRHYDIAPAAMIGHNETEPLGLSIRERRQLEEFIRSL